MSTIHHRAFRACQLAWHGLLALAALLLATLPAAAATQLDFEAIAPRTVLNAQFGPSGVLFQTGYVDTDESAHSGKHIVRTYGLNEEVFTPISFALTFTSAQSEVELFAGCYFSAANATLFGYDANGDVVATDGPHPLVADAYQTEFSLAVQAPSIVRLELRPDTVADLGIDDLRFDGEPPAATPTIAPTVTFLEPLDGAELDNDVLGIAGTVSGEGLLSTADLTMSWHYPPETTAPPYGSTLDLLGVGTDRQFLFPAFSGLPLGPIEVTVAATNTGNLTGSATVTITNFPSAIRTRFATEQPPLGPFAFGLTSPGCKIAVYESGAISLDADGTTFVFRGDILDKWLSLRTLTANDSLGCPLEEQHEGLGGSVAQTFRGGRIYANLPGAAYVPTVFVNALDQRGGEAANGIPLGDPTDSAFEMRTWLYQRFQNPDHQELLPATLEIRGTPPRLWMERQAGGWLLPQLEPSLEAKDRGKSAASLWESFACDDDLGPCQVDAEPASLPSSPDAGDRFCNGTTYLPTLEGTELNGVTMPREWASVRGDFSATSVFGAIISAHMTDIDNGFTHETHNGNCPYLPDLLAPIASYVTCVSDYEWEVHPIGPQGDTAPLPSLFGKGNTDRIRTEYEVAYASAAHNFLGAPATGDLVHATGRWIVDCGHSSFKTELHPIFSYARMNTVVTETNSRTGLEDALFGGKPATRVAIWVNGWFPGGEQNAIELDAFPPPRPTPDSVLHVVKPIDFAPGGYRAAEDVSLEFSLAPPEAVNHVHLRLTSPFRQNPVTAAGEMKFDSGRQYWGIWYLYWGD